MYKIVKKKYIFKNKFEQVEKKDKFWCRRVS